MSAHHPRKRFGQHFLADDAVIDAIVRAIGAARDDAMVEIGPGLGALTLPLARQVDALTVIELDRDLAARLRGKAGLEVIQADVLGVDFAALASARGRKLRLVGNLPYNVSTPILFHALESAACIQDQHFMLQKEVVERMVAPPGGKAYGRLSVMLQWRYAMESVLDVPPASFDPPPKVDSALVRMAPRDVDALRGIDTRRLEALLRVAFSQRRKLMRHTLGPWLEGQGHEGNFDLQRRAEEVRVEDYVALCRALPPSAASVSTARSGPHVR
jgi:16S rRNA (adenine1518-N6/adenine1519-N6)-dimethyltransferase